MDIDGLMDGFNDGSTDGLKDGVNDDGVNDGVIDGLEVGTTDGVMDGLMDGLNDGSTDCLFTCVQYPQEEAGDDIRVPVVDEYVAINSVIVTNTPPGLGIFCVAVSQRIPGLVSLLPASVDKANQEPCVPEAVLL